MPSYPSREESRQSSLAEQFSADLLWKHSIPSFKDQIKLKATGAEFKGLHNFKEFQWDQGVFGSASLISLDSIPLYNDQRTDGSPDFKQKCRFYSDKLVFYPVALNPKRKEDQPKKCINNLTRGQFKGFTSKESGKMIRQRYEAWFKAISINKREYPGKFKPKHSHNVFITLTLPSKQVHGDNEIKRSILMPFLQQLKRRNGIEESGWHAEPQENGNIHFHILIDRYVRKELLQDLWNMATNHLGYLDRYVQETGDCDPPSTQIMVCPPDMSLVKYVLKYVTKQPHIQYAHSNLETREEFKHSYWQSEELKKGSSEVVERGLEVGVDALDLSAIMCRNRITIKDGKFFRWYERRPIEGRSWGMSKGLSKINIFSADVSYRIRDIRSILQWDPEVKFVQNDHCEIFYCNVYDVLVRYDPTLRKQYDQHYLKVYRDLYLPPELDQSKVTPVIPLDCVPVYQQPKFIQKSLLFG